jgi:hypothetical protein
MDQEDLEIEGCLTKIHCFYYYSRTINAEFLVVESVILKYTKIWEILL